ncbi:right-handed parallel beta-helix repeat-containing protein [Lacisediminimonas profundi]|uniref:right-handed parallel beta-helix repeat-containing protein n=1 Tax=Lacisediminimonas profundi TaxID=2603856 RepID=UPI00124B45DD|nr:right-handed parallel beta-helix repeat-containing protein [Lacisediminimonas profundi]
MKNILAMLALSLAVSSVIAQPEPAARKTAAIQMHPLPQSVANNSTVTLHCGRHYFGTLNLNQRSNVTVRTEGNCGKASITPAQQVRGWTRQRGSIWVAPIAFLPAQVTWNDKPLALAHYPNKPWAKGTSSGPMRVQASMPNDDLAGATLVYRPEEWMIETRAIREYDNGAIVLGPKVGDAFDPKPETEFYVEGKLWMLDSPGEWAYHDGWLFVWPPDGQSPEGRIWAGPKANGIDADQSRNITIENVRVHTAMTGISAGDSGNLHVRNVEIANSAQDGIFAGGRGLLVDGARIVNSVRNGILGYYGITDVAVINSTIENTGMVGMPKRSKGGIAFEQASGTRVFNNKVLNSSYIGIRVHRNATVSNNLVDGACLVLSDCGGIYTFAPDRQPLEVRIEGNTVRNLAGRYAYAVYLDDSANGVTVSRNMLVNNPGGIEIHNGFNNVISDNVIADSGFEHILFNETGNDHVLRNRVVRNLFITGKKEATFRLWSGRGGRTNAQFAEFEDNVYVGPSANFAELQGTGMVSWSAWRSRMGQDARSKQEGNMEIGRERQRKWAGGATIGRMNP